jgi:hypothetical protein
LHGLWRLRGLPLLLTLFALLLFGQVMPHSTAGNGTDDPMMARHMARHGTYRRALDAAARFDLPRAAQKHEARQRDHH